MEEVIGFRNIFADEIGHVDFASMDSDAHGGDGAEKCGGGQDEDEQRHPAYPFESFSESHESWPISGFRFALQV